jgi:hypothetical protein
MHTIEQLILALNIFAAHVEGGLQHSFLLDADHDIIYAGADSNDLPETSEDGKKLMALGWFFDDDIDCWCYNV